MNYGSKRYYLITKVKSFDNKIQEALSNPLNNKLWMVDHHTNQGKFPVDCQNKNRPKIKFIHTETLFSEETYKLKGYGLDALIEASGVKSKRARNLRDSDQHGESSRQRIF